MRRVPPSEVPKGTVRVKTVPKEDWVECILDHDGDLSNIEILEFKVRWEGYGSEDDEWLYYSQVRDLKALDEYLALHPELQGIEDAWAAYSNKHTKKSRGSRGRSSGGRSITSRRDSEGFPYPVDSRVISETGKVGVITCLIPKGGRRLVQFDDGQEQWFRYKNLRLWTSGDINGVESASDNQPKIVIDELEPKFSNKSEVVTREIEVMFNDPESSPAKTIEDVSAVSKRRESRLKEGFPCEVCGKVLRSAQALKYHYDHVCTWDGPAHSKRKSPRSRVTATTVHHIVDEAVADSPISESIVKRHNLVAEALGSLEHDDSKTPIKSVDEIAVSTGKRKRGRSASKDQKLKSERDEDVVVLSPVPTRRPRGRPRKRMTTDSDVANQTGGESITDHRVPIGIESDGFRRALSNAFAGNQSDEIRSPMNRDPLSIEGRNERRRGRGRKVISLGSKDEINENLSHFVDTETKGKTSIATEMSSSDVNDISSTIGVSPRNRAGTRIKSSWKEGERRRSSRNKGDSPSVAHPMQPVGDGSDHDITMLDIPVSRKRKRTTSEGSSVVPQSAPFEKKKGDSSERYYAPTLGDTTIICIIIGLKLPVKDRRHQRNYEPESVTLKAPL